MLGWISQTIAVTSLSIRTIPQRLGSSAGRHCRDRRRRHRVRRRAVDRRGIQGGDDRSPARRAVRSSCEAARTRK